MLKFYRKVFKIFIYSATFQIILGIFGIQIAAMEDVHPKLYQVPCLPSSLQPPAPPPPPPPHTHTHNTNYDQDFKVIFFYFIDKGELGELSCLAPGLV